MGGAGGRYAALWCTISHKMMDIFWTVQTLRKAKAAVSAYLHTCYRLLILCLKVHFGICQEVPGVGIHQQRG